MATVPERRRTREVSYPPTDGKPMGESELHIDELIDAFQVLRGWYASAPNVYVGGDLMLYYEEGNPRKHVSPDIFVALDVPRAPKREYYLLWKEGKGPDLVVEITSRSTRREDMQKKFALYRDVLTVSEYFLFDPRAEYLDPPLRGFRLTDGEYSNIEPVAGRLPSEVLGLHLAREAQHLRLFNPVTGQRLLTMLEAREMAERLADEERQRAGVIEEARRSLAEENDRLRKEIEALRGGG